MRAVIFDFDGVLVDSEPVHFHALRDALASEGIAITAEEYVRTYLAYDDREALRLALELHHQPADVGRLDALAARKAALFDARAREIAFFPGARELVKQLAAELPLAIASGALRREIESILEAGGLRGAFQAIVGADDVERCKPDPEPYLLALRRLQALSPRLEAGECLVIEDSMPGIAAGLAAGMKVLGVANSYPAARLGAAHRVVASLVQVERSSLEALFQS